MLGNFVVSLLIAGPLSQLLGAIKSLQIILHVILINVFYPATAMMFFGMLMSILTFQFYDFSELYDKVFGFSSYDEGNESLNSQFDLMGYTSLYII